MVLLIPTINYLTCISILNASFGRSEIVSLKGQTFTRCIKNLVRIWKKYSWLFWWLSYWAWKMQWLLSISHTVKIITHSLKMGTCDSVLMWFLWIEQETFKHCKNRTINKRFQMLPQLLSIVSDRKKYNKRASPQSLHGMDHTPLTGSACVMLAVATWAVLKDGCPQSPRIHSRPTSITARPCASFLSFPFSGWKMSLE